MAFVDYWNELRGYVPKLSAPLAQKLVNRAWQDIRGARLWSFQVVEGGLASPTVIDGGTVAVTHGLTTVTADAVVAKPLLDAVVTDTLNPLVSRQFRVTSEGPIYRISLYNNSTGVITLDRPYLGSTNATIQYQVYRCYFTPPVSNFVRYWSVLDPDQAYQLNLRRYPTKAHLDRIDPQRGSAGQSCYVTHFEYDSLNKVPLHEFWPHPTSNQTFQCLCQTNGADLSPTVDLPPTIPVDLLMMRARYRAYEWGLVNQGVYKELRGVDFRFLMKQFDDARGGRTSASAPNSYQTALMRARKIDEELLVRNIVFFRGRGFSIPIDASYMQSHDVDLMIR